MKIKSIQLYSSPLQALPSGKILINTINAHSYNSAQKDSDFKTALLKSDILLPDGISIVAAFRFLTGQRISKIAGADLFAYEMEQLNTSRGKCFFLGSSEATLQKIRERARNEYPNVQVYTYSPPYKPKFSESDNHAIVSAVNSATPDVLFIGMTAPKQEKWAYTHFQDLNTGHICSIGAVFDFYAGTVSRAPQWMIAIGLEWFFRLVKEPRRMWRRYLIGNIKFIGLVVKEKWAIKNFK